MLLLITIVCFPILTGGVWEPEATFVVPEDRQYVWKRINVSSLECPNIYSVPRLSRIAQVALLRPEFTGSFDDAVQGYICSKVKMSVKCSVNFFGWRSFEHLVEDVVPSRQECLEGVRTLQVDGKLSSPAFPAPNCGWMDDRWAEDLFLILTSHPTHGDPYTGDFIDKIFPAGICGTDDCPTIHHGSRWVTTNRTPSSCTRFQTSWANIGNQEDPPHTRVVYSPEFGVRSLEGSCTIRFCGKSGWRLETGEFFVLSSPGGTSLGIPPLCERGVKIGELSLQGQLDYTRLELLDQETRLQCLTTLATIVATNKVSPFQLGMFNPTHPGNGRAYRIRQKFLEEALVRYVGVTKLDDKPRNNRLSVDHQGKPVMWSDWVEVPGTNRTFGPNGLLKLPTGEIVIPNKEIRALRHNLQMTVAQDIDLVGHPHREITQNFSDQIGLSSRNTATDGGIDPFGWIKSKWGSLGGGLTTLIVAGLILWLLGRCICKRSPSNSVPTIKLSTRDRNWEKVATTSV